MKKTHYTVPIFVPELSCNNKCIYCNQQNISNTHSIPDAKQVHSIIQEKIAQFPTWADNIQIAFFGGNFTGIDRNIQEAYLQTAQYFIDKNKAHSIRISTRPDYINQDKLSLLAKYHVKNIELGAQSMCDEVLIQSGRGHNSRCTKEASHLILKNGFQLGLQMMIGLPNDNKEKALLTAQEIVKLGASETRIYPLLVLKNTPLFKHYSEGKYPPLSIAETIETATPIVETFEKAGIKILRIGLHPSDFIHNGELVAGPWHPALSQMIYTKLWSNIFKTMNKEYNQCTIYVSSTQYPNAIGFQRENAIKYPDFLIKSKHTLQGMQYEIHNSR